MESLQARVAVIDDDLSVRRSLERLLRLNGFEVESYSSPESFLSMNCTDTYNCLVLDIHFDGMSGVELERLLAGSKASVPVVFISAEDASQIAALPLNCAFLHKPFSGSLLMKTIDLAIKSSAAGR